MQKIFFAVVLSLLISCGDGYKTIHEQYIEINKGNLKDDSLITDPATGSVFSRLKRSASFGRMFKYALKDDDLNKQFLLVFSGKIRSNYAQSNSTIAIVAHDKDNKQLCWRSISLRPHYPELNKWCYFTDQIKLEPIMEGKELADITVVAYLSTSPGEVFDMDTLHIAVKRTR